MTEKTEKSKPVTQARLHAETVKKLNVLAGEWELTIAEVLDKLAGDAINEAYLIELVAMQDRASKTPRVPKPKPGRN